MKFSDTTITFNPDFTPEMYVQIPRTKELELERTDPFIVLAHEMIHADRAMRGNYISDGNPKSAVHYHPITNNSKIRPHIFFGDYPNLTFKLLPDMSDLYY